MKTIQLRTETTRLVTNQIELMPLERILAWYESTFFRPEKAHTMRAKRHDFDSLRQFLFEETGTHASKLFLSDLTEARLSSWTEWCLEDEAPSTVNRRMATVKHLCNEIKKRVPAWHNPASELSDLPTETVYRGIPEEYQEALIRAAYQLYDEKRPGVRFYRARAGLMVEIALLCGLRAGEILGLTPGHISRDARWFMNVRCKGRKFLNKHIVESLQGSLQNWLPYREDVLCEHYAAYAKLSDDEKQKTPLLPTLSRDSKLPMFLDYRTLWRVFADAAKVVDGGHFTPHQYRHAYAQKLLSTSGDVALVADDLGHADLKTTMIYLKRSDEHRANAVANAWRRK